MCLDPEVKFRKGLALIKMDKVFDTVIIGAGPAGLSAAIYVFRKGLNVLLLSKNIGGNIIYAGEVENYLGFTLISGGELAAKFRDDIKRFEGVGATVKEGAEVMTIEGEFPNFLVKTKDSQTFQGKTIIIASGRVPKLLGVPGEKKFLGKGVAVCATCDAPFYKGKDVIVAGGGNAALDSVISLLPFVRSITMVNDVEDLMGDKIRADKIVKAPNVKILNNQQVLEILGENTVSGMKVKDKKTGQEQILLTEGVFVEVGYTPSTGFDKLTKKDGAGQIIVDQSGTTSVPGVFAAGDVNNLWGEQMIIAAGEGAKTALAVADLLAKTPH